MITRVTNQTMMRTAQHNLQTNAAQLAKLQSQASSQNKISRPSDDPSAAANSLQVRAQQRANEQYGRNIDDGNGWLTTVDSALAATTTLMNSVRDLTVQGANDGAMSQPAKEAIAIQLESLKKDLLARANTQYGGRSVFAGNSDAKSAFDMDADGAVSFKGDPGSSVQRRINENTTVAVDADGSTVFGGDGDKDGDSIFALIDNIVSDLRSGDANAATHLEAIDARLQAIVGQHSAVGARQAQIERAGEANMEKSGTLEAQRSRIEDIDLGQAILDLKVQEVSYQAALAVTARVLQPTLMDFLR